ARQPRPGPPSAARPAARGASVPPPPPPITRRPPPAAAADPYAPTPAMPPPSTSRRPHSSSTSRTELSTPWVTSSTGASTVVGASPRTARRYSSPRFSMRIALVVVEPQSVARTVAISLIVAPLARDASGRQVAWLRIAPGAPPSSASLARSSARLEPAQEELDGAAAGEQRRDAIPRLGRAQHRSEERPEEHHRLAGDERQRPNRLQEEHRR